MISENPVDVILDGWFGEPVENAENASRLEYLYAPLRELFVRKGADDRPISYEYQVTQYLCHPVDIADKLMNKGRDGWETVSVQSLSTAAHFGHDEISFLVTARRRKRS